ATGDTAATACDRFDWYQHANLTSDGDRTHTFVAANGCDSVVTLHLTIKSSTTGVDPQTACDSYTWIDGQTYTASNTTATHTLTAANGCDSVVTLNLTIKSSTTGVDPQTACDSYTWIDGQTYTASNTTATHTLTAANGCDSVVTLNLVVNYSTSATMEVQAEKSYTFEGSNYVTSGTYTFDKTNVAGCDSVLTLILSVITYAPEPEILAYDDKTVMVNHYPNGRGGERAEYIAYRWYHNGTLIPGATDDKFFTNDFAALTGEYFVEVATDESQRYWVASNTIDFSARKAMLDLYDEDTRLVVYPNPVRRGAQVMVRITNDDRYMDKGGMLKVYDMRGHLVYSVEATMAEQSLAADFATGVYTVVYEVPNREPLSAKLVVK
ncbi:MAG: T9SS type A sorting domain-containing protein, partial [Bacteroidales bacterium]|nr:T9SS type A sorting domain-containing protein [Bacteroidales bacterium]